jgi:hypothetical protein
MLNGRFNNLIWQVPLAPSNTTLKAQERPIPTCNTSSNARPELSIMSTTSNQQCMIHWALDITLAELHNATVQATYVRHFRSTPGGEVANMHGYLTMGWRALRLPKKSSSVWPEIVLVVIICG